MSVGKSWLTLWSSQKVFLRLSERHKGGAVFGPECLAFSKERHLSFLWSQATFHNKTKQNKNTKQNTKTKQGNNPQTTEDESKGEHDSRFHLLQERLALSILNRIIWTKIMSTGWHHSNLPTDSETKSNNNKIFRVNSTEHVSPNDNSTDRPPSLKMSNLTFFIFFQISNA